MKESGSANHPSQSPTAEMQVENTHFHNDIPPKKPPNIALTSEDSNNNLAPISESSPPVWPWKKVQKKILESSEDDEEVLSSLLWKKIKKQILESSEDDDKVPSSVQPQKKTWVSSEDTCQKNKSKKLTGQSKKSSNNCKKGAHNDSEIEIIENSQKTPEEELGKWNQNIISKSWLHILRTSCPDMELTNICLLWPPPQNLCCQWLAMPWIHLFCAYLQGEWNWCWQGLGDKTWQEKVINWDKDTQQVSTVLYIWVVGNGSPADNGRAQGHTVQHTPTMDRV